MTANIHITEATSSGAQTKEYSDIHTAIANAPAQYELQVRGNVVVDKPIELTGTYCRLVGLGGGNRADDDGIASIKASDSFEGETLLDLSGLGSKWGSVENINLFCNARAEIGIRSGVSDNGYVSNVAVYRPTRIGIKNESGAFDNVFHRVLIDGDFEMETGIHLTGGNEPKVLESLIRRYTDAGAFIDGVGRVGPRIENTSFRGGADTEGNYGVKIQNSGQTGNINIHGCQFEDNHGGGIGYCTEGNEGSIARFWVAGCHFNANNAKSIEINKKVGKYTIGPANQFMGDVELNESAWSQDGSTLFCNTIDSGEIVDNSDKDLTIFEPMIGRFEFCGKEVQLGSSS